MAWQYHCFTPTDPWHIPAPDRLQRAVEYVKANVHRDVDVDQHELASLIGNPSVTRFAMKCPSCGTIGDDFDWVADALTADWERLSEDRDAVRPVAPCCGVAVSMFDLTFPCLWANERPTELAWQLYQVAGFGCVSITLTNPDRPVEQHHLREVEAIIGHPMKLIYYVL